MDETDWGLDGDLGLWNVLAVVWWMLQQTPLLCIDQQVLTDGVRFVVVFRWKIYQEVRTRKYLHTLKHDAEKKLRKNLKKMFTEEKQKK